MINYGKCHRRAFVISDYVTTSVAWLLFNIVRYFEVDEVNYVDSLGHFLLYPDILWGQLLFPVMMMGLYWLSGFYSNTYSKSRIEIISQTFLSIIPGILIIYFVAIIDDPIPDKYSNYVLLLMMGSLMTVMVLAGRMIIATAILRRIARGQYYRRALIVGDGDRVEDCVMRLEKNRRSMGLEVTAVSFADGDARGRCPGYEAVLFDGLESECTRRDLDCIILAVSPGDSVRVLELVRRLYSLHRPVMLPAWSAGSILARMRVSNIPGEPLTDIAAVSVNEYQRNIKRVLDVAVSSVALVLLAPMLAVLAVMVRHDSPGPAIYTQERVGMNRRRFKIYKFRTMTRDAEHDGPALSSEDDPRITRLGHTMRKYRLDELPQFWNVLKGDMSLVGPRPERAYFEEKILERAPHYALVHQVRPGLTSWGMVKYGYATNVDQMIERLAYDMIYLENISVALDVKIMFYTVRTVVTGKGV